MILESADPVTIRSSLLLPCRAHTLSWCASNVFTHSLVLMVQSFTRPSEPLQDNGGRRQRQRDQKPLLTSCTKNNNACVYRLCIVGIFCLTPYIITGHFNRNTGSLSNRPVVWLKRCIKSCCRRARASNTVHIKHHNGEN